MISRLLKILVFITVASLIAGCKLAVILIEGGEIQSVGSGTCMTSPTVPQTGIVCIHEVADTAYSETFTAVPDTGWEFVRWNTGDGFLCADSTNPVCVTTNVLLAGNVYAEAIVASDTTFYIMPIFEFVPPLPPVAEAGPDVFQDEGPEESVFLDGSLSSDPDGAIVTWLWDFGDETPASTASSPRHSYESAGLFLITLTVTDDQGLMDTDTTLATVFGNNDTAGPLILHEEIEDGQVASLPVLIQAELLDPAGTTNAVLFYRPIGNSGAQFEVMADQGGDIWQATIPAAAITTAGVEYWITATDGFQPAANSSTRPTGAPNSSVWNFSVVPPNP